MQSDFKSILHLAEDHYLKRQEIEAFKLYKNSLAKRLEIYELLSAQEIEIFQLVANELLKAYPQENSQLIEKALKHWLSIMRYCAMAMLLNNPEYLQQSILEWLKEMVQAHQMQSVENTIYNLLFSHLQKRLSQEQFALMQPFLNQTQAILGDKITTTAGR